MELRRPDPISDFDDVLALMQAADRSVYGATDWTELELREEWEGIDLGRDAWLAVDEGTTVGVAQISDIREGRIITDGYVHPGHTGRGAGGALLHAVEARARELEPGLVPGERVYLETAHLVGDPGAPKLFASRGYRRVRSFFRLVRPLGADEPLPSLPAGLELRPFVATLHGPAVHAAHEEAFVEEWGHRPRDYPVWSEKVIGWSRFDPELFVVIWDGDEVVGFSLNYDKRMGDWGWIGRLGVRPAWRRRGLGLALLHESFRRFAGRGETTAALGVDSENPTGATRLYERAGMSELWRADVWQKELR